MTVTPVRSTSPVFSTLMLKVTSEPLATVCSSGVLAISMAGLITSTKAMSMSVTTSPTGGVPVTVALLVKSAVTLARVHS